MFGILRLLCSLFFFCFQMNYLVQLLINATLEDKKSLEELDEYVYNRSLLKNEEEEKKVFDWFEEQLKWKSSPVLENCMGLCYQLHIGVHPFLKTDEEQLKYFTAAHEKGLDIATINLATLFSNRLKQYDNQVYELYYSVFKKSSFINFSYVMALNGLGLCYKYGMGTDQNEFQAFRWFQQAANLGSKAAWFNLFLCYREGYGVKSNDEKAYHILSQLSMNPFSLIIDHYMGLLHRDGFGCPKDEEKMVHYFQRAAMRKHRHSINELILFYRTKKEFRDIILWKDQEDMERDWKQNKNLEEKEELIKMSNAQKMWNILLQRKNNYLASELTKQEFFSSISSISFVFNSCIFLPQTKFLFMMTDETEKIQSIFCIPDLLLLIARYI